MTTLAMVSKSYHFQMNIAKSNSLDEMQKPKHILTTMVTMKIADRKVPNAMYKLCKPTVFPFEMTALKLDSSKGRACVVDASTSVGTSFVFTIPSKTNSSETTHTKVFV